MRVLWVLDTLEVGGAESSLLAMGQHLVTATPVVCHLYPGAALAPRFRAAGIEVVSLDLQGRYSPLQAVRRLAAVARRQRADLLHSTLVRAGLAARGARVLAGRPLVHTWVNEPVVSPRAAGRPGWRRRAVHLADRATAGLVDRFVANTADVADLHVQALGVPRRKVEVIHRGRDAAELAPPAPAALAALRAELGLADGNRVLVNVGRLRPQKGQDLLLHAFARLVPGRPELRLVVAGDGPERTALEALAERLGVAGATRFPGHRGDVAALLALADVFVFPSRREGHPGALLEAMFAGRPIVASDLPAHRETVEDGASARLVPGGDAAALAAAVAELLDDPAGAAALAAAARRRAEERFTIARAARAHERLYAEVLAAAGKTPVQGSRSGESHSGGSRA